MSRTIGLTSAIAGLALLTFLGLACQSWVKEHDFKTPEDAIDFALSAKLITLVYYTRPLPKGARLEQADLRVALRWQPKYPQDAISDPKEVLGRAVLYPILKGAMVGYSDVGLGGHANFFKH